MLLGEPTASKTVSRGSNPRTVAGTIADVAETERRRSCKPDHAGANPVVGSFDCLAGVTDA